MATLKCEHGVDLDMAICGTCPFEGLEKEVIKLRNQAYETIL